MSFKYPDTCLVIFAKAPVPGKVKTRLIPALGEASACHLYEQMLTNIVDRFAQASLCPIHLYCQPDITHDVFTQMAQQPGIKLYVQEGCDLGERMLAACSQALTTYSKVVVIGTDCPDYSTSYLETAIHRLDENDVVVGPAYDGGYVLIGMNRAEAWIFAQINWGTKTVLEKTLKKIQEKDLSCYLLSTLHDIDLPNDLIYLTPPIPHKK